MVWHIPVCLRAASGKTICDILDEPRESIRVDACPTWVMGNASARGYYRFAASPEAVRRLSDDGRAALVSERVALVSDEWSLARSSRHDIGVYLDLACGFRQERTETVLETLTRPLGTIGDYMAGPRRVRRFRSLDVRAVVPGLDEIGMTPQPQETDRNSARCARRWLRRWRDGARCQSAGKGARAGASGARQAAVPSNRRC